MIFMDKIKKALRKLSQKERNRTKEVLKKINQAETRSLDLKKLKGYSDIFRVRKGDLRIIYRQTGKQIFILRIERKKEKTYKEF